MKHKDYSLEVQVKPFQICC